MKILVGYDGSNESKEALRLAKKHAKGMDAKIEIANAIARWEPLEYHKIQENEQELNQEVKKNYMEITLYTKHIYWLTI